MRRMLPALQTFDGERTVLADAALPKHAADALAELTFPEPESWLKDFDWGEDGADSKRGGAEALGTLKGEPEFDALVTECKRLSAKAQTLVEDYRQRTPR